MIETRTSTAKGVPEGLIPDRISRVQAERKKVTEEHGRPLTREDYDRLLEPFDPGYQHGRQRHRDRRDEARRRARP